MDIGVILVIFPGKMKVFDTFWTKVIKWEGLQRDYIGVIT